MKLADSERPTPPGPPAVLLHSGLLSFNDPQRFHEWLEARKQFVDKMGWPSGENDLDEYDEIAETKHVGLYGESDELVFGMRLTPYSDLGQTLSWRIVEQSTIPDQAVASGNMQPDRAGWDLTRLVPGLGISDEVSQQAIPRLFGEGLRQCIASGDENPLWVFALDAGMAAYLKRQEVDITVLGKERLAGDRRPTTFGCIEPATLAAMTETSDFARRAMEIQHVDD